MRVAIVGSRNVKNINFKKFLSYIPKNCTHIISGGAVGIDFMAEVAANYLETKLTVIKPDYKTFGRKAPLVRNGQIVKQSDYVVAFWDMKSHGTAHTIKLCQSFEIPYKIVDISFIK